jgi:hypothetical protein
MAMLNAPTMECERVNLRRSVSVQKRQQTFETVPARHSGTFFRTKWHLLEQVEPQYSQPFIPHFENARRCLSNPAPVTKFQSSPVCRLRAFGAPKEMLARMLRCRGRALFNELRESLQIVRQHPNGSEPPEFPGTPRSLMRA